MDKIQFTNNAQPAINDTNLNLMQDNIENAINKAVEQTILFEDENGIIEDITLSETVSNFKNIEIYFTLPVTEATYNFSQKINIPNNKRVGYSLNRPTATLISDNPILQIFGGRLKVENTTITREMETFVIVNGSSGKVTNGSNETNIRIVKVIGYR